MQSEFLGTIPDCLKPQAHFFRSATGFFEWWSHYIQTQPEFFNMWTEHFGSSSEIIKFQSVFIQRWTIIFWSSTYSFSLRGFVIGRKGLGDDWITSCTRHSADIELPIFAEIQIFAFTTKHEIVIFVQLRYKFFHKSMYFLHGKRKKKQIWRFISNFYCPRFSSLQFWL